MRGAGSTVACESALRSAGTLLSRVRAPLPAPWPDGGPESLRSPCCGLAIYKKLKPCANAYTRAKLVVPDNDERANTDDVLDCLFDLRPSSKIIAQTPALVSDPEDVLELPILEFLASEIENDL
ncbi:hypothetical protein PoB_005514700 [Plakobranchus ocellatus]|uniref:Uncharacterized protein n=1 Tax=Plakobranchus ocellatus TaxID=259542 RepID=A0AAV4CB99_9GAST|nr:hypothetical protein PoB_005514700 [Plakobranchus ocellatus]